MAVKNTSLRLLAVVLCAGWLAAAVPCQAGGYYNTPSSLCQCFGCGFCPGYHANWLLGPVCKNKPGQKRLIRLPARPCPHGTECSTCTSAPVGPSFYPAAASPAYHHLQPFHHQPINGTLFTAPPLGPS